MSPLTRAALLFFSCLALASIATARKQRTGALKHLEEMSAETRLMIHLKRKYGAIGTETRPVVNASAPIDVKFGYTLIAVDQYSAHQISLVGWLNLQWEDFRVVWDPEEWDGVSVLRMPIEYIWKPDIRLYNSLDSEMQQTMSTFAVVYSTGTVSWVPPTNMRVLTKQEGGGWWSSTTYACELKFGSWTYNGDQLSLNFIGQARADVDTYGGHLKIVGNKAKKNTVTYPCCPEPYIDLTFDLKFSE